MSSRIAVVTGANRGIGLEIVRQLAAAGDTVLLGCRDLAKGRAAAAHLHAAAAQLDAAAGPSPHGTAAQSHGTAAQSHDTGAQSQGTAARSQGSGARSQAAAAQPPAAPVHLDAAAAQPQAASARVEGAPAQLQGEIHPIELDVANPAHADELARTLESRFGRLDILVNNAAIHYDTWQSAAGADLGVVREAFETNVLGAWQVTQAVLPLLRRSEHPRIVNVSSEAGSLASMGPWAPAYNVSKVSLNALTVMWAKELRGMLVNSICPGWVATDMGGPGGRPVGEGAASVLWAVNLPDNGPTGGFYRDTQPIPW